MNDYSLDSDSSRWWWPQAAAGAVATAAITAILVVPATVAAGPGASTLDVPPASDSWLATVDPGIDRPCFLVRAKWNASLEQMQPRCGHALTEDREPWTGARRPGLGFRP